MSVSQMMPKGVSPQKHFSIILFIFLYFQKKKIKILNGKDGGIKVDIKFMLNSIPNTCVSLPTKKEMQVGI